MNKPTILVTAYAVNPYKGSEDGTGWNLILQISRHQKVIAITRENNQAAIEKYLASHAIPEAENIQFEYFDTPYYTRFWKKGGRGALIYFYMWQYAVTNWIKQRSWEYDIVHNLNFHSDWTPSFLWKTGKPLVWGPIGHHPKIPQAFLEPYNKKEAWKENLKWAAKKLFWRFDPFLKKTKRKARHIFAINSSVSEVLNLNESKVSILPAIASNIPDVFEKTDSASFHILSIGRLVSMKGFDLTINAFAGFYNALEESVKDKVSLTIVGSGAEEPFLKRLITKNKLEDAVKIIPWMERNKLAFVYQSADLFLFPSHEGAGMVVAEALSYGLPVMCLDNCGPGEFITPNCGIKIPYQSYTSTLNRLTEELQSLHANPTKLMRLSKGAKRLFNARFQWDVKGEHFRMVYDLILKRKEQYKFNEATKEDYIYTPSE